jgi:hypothetical protein
MSRLLSIALAAAFLIAQGVGVSAQTPAPKKMSRAHLHELFVKWKQNRPKLAACRKEARSKGLAGDDRWFFMEECMDKS